MSNFYTYVLGGSFSGSQHYNLQLTKKRSASPFFPSGSFLQIVTIDPLTMVLYLYSIMSLRDIGVKQTVQQNYSIRLAGDEFCGK